MRRKDREIKDLSKIEQIINQARFLHLGMFDGEFPYVVPLHYGFINENDKFIFYCHSALEGKKLDCIKNNSNVFIEIDTGEKLITADTACKYGAEYKSVMCTAKATIVEDKDEKMFGLKLLMKTQTGKDFEIPRLMLNAVTVIRLEVLSISAKECKR